MTIDDPTSFRQVTSSMTRGQIEVAYEDAVTKFNSLGATYDPHPLTCADLLSDLLNFGHCQEDDVIDDLTPEDMTRYKLTVETYPK